MKKLSLGIFLIALLTLVTTPGLAQTQISPVQAQDQARIQIQSVETPTGAAVRNQNQVRTENQGEETGLNVSTAERKSEVAKAVEELLSAADRSGGIGQEIREIARTHNESQSKAEEKLSQSQAKAPWRRFVLGPDFKALKEIRQEATQMQARIRELEQLQNKLANQGVSQQVRETIQSAIQTLEQERAALLEEVVNEENRFSLFGWLRKLLG